MNSNTKDTVFKLWTGAHKAIFTLSGGRVLGRAAGMQMLLLRTTGRKSGVQRETMLSTPVVDGETVVLVASFGGDDRDPAWFLNLKQNPAVEIVMGGRTRAMVARVATGEEKEALWPRVVGTYKGYAGYQRKTDRDIPLVLLDPA